MINITVFTPTYNRGNMLPVLYESLCSQTNQDFIWLIVDDGSTDETEQLVLDWIEANKLRIDYHRQANMGKMRAHNKAAIICETKYFVCVDSDDYLVDDAIEIIAKGINEIDNEPTIAGLISRRKYITEKDEKIYCDIHKKYTTLHGLYEQGFQGETTIVFKTDILRKFPFPVVDGEIFIPENISYDLIDQDYEYYYESKMLAICVYNPDGYTKNFLRFYTSNPCGYINYYYQAATLYHNIGYKRRAYMLTFFIKDKNVREKYREKGYDFSTQMIGVLMYIRIRILLISKTIHKFKVIVKKSLGRRLCLQKVDY